MTDAFELISLFSPNTWFRTFKEINAYGQSVWDFDWKPFNVYKTCGYSKVHLVIISYLTRTPLYCLEYQGHSESQTPGHGHLF